MNARALLIAVITCLGILLVWLTAFWDPIPPRPVIQIQTHAQSNTHSREKAAGGDFTLQTKNRPLALHDYRGKVVILYFGYTFCPDVCPTSLSLSAQALRTLTPQEQTRVQGVFVSIDPERDTLEHLHEYAPFFHPAITGATGSNEAVTAVASQYGVTYQKQKPRPDGSYAVDHSSATYIIDTNGRLAASLPHGSAPQTIADAIRPLLTGHTHH